VIFIEGMGNSLESGATHAFSISAMMAWSWSDKLGYLGLLAVMWAIFNFIARLPND